MMKRSQINQLIQESERFFNEMNFKLPLWSKWTLADWKQNQSGCSEIFDNMLGWDLTDFGSSRFMDRGLILFTLRNGKPGTVGKTYAEKIMIVRENQETPFHFHWSKMEDIINRGGGNLVMELYFSSKDETYSDQPVTFQSDGITRTVQPGEQVVLAPGQSITLEQNMYHRFYGEPGHGKVLVGEVSMVNDDTVDNRFYDKVGRFPEIEEDEAPYRLLVSDYQAFIMEKVSNGSSN